jgi:replicative DNA helicase
MTEYLPPEPTTSSGTASIPHNREAEEAVVGAVLINSEVYYDVAQFLQADDFYIHRHKWIWEAFTSLHEQRIPVDLLTLTEELDRKGLLAEIGGPAYLTALVNQVPTSLNAESYGHIVESHSIRRRMIQAANSIASMAYNEDSTINNVMDEAEKAVFNVSERRLKHDVEPISVVLSEYYDRIDDLAKRDDDIFGVPTGFIDLDKMLGGLQSSDLLIIAGRPGQGKTGFLLSIAKNAALTHKKHVAIFSLEMSNEQVVQRLIAQETGIDSQRLRTGKLQENEWPLFTHAVEVMSDTHIFLDDTPAITPLQLRTKCRRLHLEHHLDLIMVDYLQLMGGDTRTENRVQEVSYISRNLKVLARELNVPVLAAAQLSRAVEQRSDKRPVLSDLRESGCLSGDTLVTLAEGDLKVPIGELEGRSGFDIWALNAENGKLERAVVSRAFSTGIKPVYNLKTSRGRSLRATANHPFRTLQGWTRLDQLQIGQMIALPAERRNISEQTHANQAIARPDLIPAASGAQAGKIGNRISPLYGDKRMKRWANLLTAPQPGRWDEPDISWDSIHSVIPHGLEQVFDLTVPGHHNFVANDIIVHNSLEQDADIVMFIYRPDQYEKDTVKQNVAEIMIAKHRNGPVGSVELVFRTALAKFENAATRNFHPNE